MARPVISGPVVTMVLISSPFWWPGNFGSKKSFRVGALSPVSSSGFSVVDAEFFADTDCYTRVSSSASKLRVECFNRKGKELEVKDLSF